MEASQPLRNRFRVVFRSGAIRCEDRSEIGPILPVGNLPLLEPLDLLRISALSIEFAACPPAKLFSRGGHFVLIRKLKPWIWLSALGYFVVSRTRLVQILCVLEQPI